MKTTVYEDHWHGTGSTDTAYVTDDPAAVAASIARLDGKVRTSVSMARGDDMLCIGGGNDARYMAYFAHNVDEALFNLVNPDAPAHGPGLKIVTGGQVGMVLPRACLNISIVTAAATYFVRTGQRAPSLHWAPG